MGPFAAADVGGSTRWVALMAAGLAMLLALRIAALAFNGTDLFFDEAQYWSWSLEPAFGYYSKPPLIAWLIRLSTEVCGMGEACVRLPSPIVHTGTALILFEVGRRLYDVQIGALAALVFATLPGVSLSAGIISTDVPLLFAWALALLGFVALMDTKAWWPALVLGVAIGIGMNAKYAMAWFILCAAVYFVVAPERRALLKDARLWVALTLGIAMIVPNVIWNAQHSFATLGHTADNAKWSGGLFHPLKALEFFGAQFGVFGPVLFGSLLVITHRGWREGLTPSDRLLMAFTWPVLAIILVQAFLSRAHANWAGVSYVAATLLVTATLVRRIDWRWLNASFALHGAIVVLIAVAAAMAGRVALPFKAEPFQRTMGWRAMAEATRAELDAARKAGRPYGAVLTDDRAVTAELLYYMQGERTPVVAWYEGGRPHDHYELTRPYKAQYPDPVLLVSLARDAAKPGEATPEATRSLSRVSGDRSKLAGESCRRGATASGA